MISYLVVAYLPHIWHTYALNVLSSLKITITELALWSGNSVDVIFYVEKKFMAYVCQMCGKYTKTKSEIIKHKRKEHITFFHSKS